MHSHTSLHKQNTHTNINTNMLTQGHLGIHKYKHMHLHAHFFFVSTRVIMNHWDINTTNADIYRSCQLHIHIYTITQRAHSTGFIMTAAQANATGSMTDPLSLSPLVSLTQKHEHVAMQSTLQRLFLQ